MSRSGAEDFEKDKQVWNAVSRRRGDCARQYAIIPDLVESSWCR